MTVTPAGANSVPADPDDWTLAHVTPRAEQRVHVLELPRPTYADRRYGATGIAVTRLDVTIARDDPSSVWRVAHVRALGSRARKGAATAAPGVDISTRTDIEDEWFAGSTPRPPWWIAQLSTRVLETVEAAAP